jgi:hypothetical protein
MNETALCTVVVKSQALEHVFVVMGLKVAASLEICHTDLCQWRDLTFPHEDLREERLLGEISMDPLIKLQQRKPW